MAVTAIKSSNRRFAMSFTWQLFLQEAFPGVDFSASGLQAVALAFKQHARKIELSNVLNAPCLESLELEFAAVSQLELSAEINVQRHDKPFQYMLVSGDRLGSSPKQPLPLQTLEKGFGPQAYNYFWGRLHQTLLKDVCVNILQSYCNAAHTRAVKARRAREAWAPRSCDYQLFRTKCLCESDLLQNR